MNLPIALHQALKEQSAHKEKPFAIFDFDNTCIINDIGEATVHYLCKNKLLKDFSLLPVSNEEGDYHERVFHAYHNLLKEGKIKEAYTLCVALLSGFSLEEARAVTQAAITAEGSEITEGDLYGRTIAHGLVLNPATMELIQLAKDAGIEVWIVSASAEISVRTAMEHFNIEANLIGVRPVMRDGRYTKELEVPMPILEGKVECMRVHIASDSMPLLVVDDSMTGITLLETADVKVVVDRNNALTREAENRGWFII